MINNIQSAPISITRNYPKLITWECNGVGNSVECNTYESWTTLVNKLVDAQIKPTPKILREIKYIRAKR